MRSPRQPILEVKGNRDRLRWRPEPGAGNYTYLFFDQDAEGKRLSEKAFSYVKGAGCDTTRERVLAHIHNVPLEEVVRAAAEHTAERKTRSPTTELPRLRELVPEYLDHLERQERTPGTIEKVAAHFNTIWLDRFGHLRIDDITGDAIRDVMNEMAECACKGATWGTWCKRRRGSHSHRRLPFAGHEPGVSKKTRDRYYASLSGVFTYAVRKRKLIPSSPTLDSGYQQQSLAKYNSVKKEEKHVYLTLAQFKLVRSRMPLKDQLMLSLLGETGLRFSEVTALTPAQFSRDSEGNPWIDVSEVFKYSKKNKYERGIPKAKATRRFMISEPLAKNLEATCLGLGKNELVFKTADNCQIVSRNYLRDVWTPAIQAAMRCPEHPPEVQVQQVLAEQLAGPTCGSNGGRNARGRFCGAKVLVGSNRCTSHRGVAREAVSNCDCTDPQAPRRLTRVLTPHDIRHTYIAWLIDKNWSDLLIAEKVGNSPEVIRAIYAGILDQTHAQMARDSAIID